MAIRLALLAHHYRADWEWTPGLGSAAAERAGPLAGRRRPGPRPRRRGRCSPGCASASPTTSTPRARSRPSTPGPPPTATTRQAPALVRDLADALLGVAL